MAGIVDTIRGRRSVRTFDARPITPEDRAYVEHVIQSIKNPFGVPVEFQLLDAAEHGLKSPVIVGAHEYRSGALAPSCSRRRSPARRLSRPWRSAQAR